MSHIIVPGGRPKLTTQYKLGWYAIRLPLEGNKGPRRHQVAADPQVAFRPAGLWLWGESATVEHFQIGGQPQFVQEVPLRSGFFEPTLTFEAFCSMIEPEGNPHHERGSVDWSQVWLPDRFPEISGGTSHFRTCNAGMRIALEYWGELSHAVVWGQAVLP